MASIPFRDNQAIIDLISKRPVGLMPILEDQVIRAVYYYGFGSYLFCLSSVVYLSAVVIPTRVCSVFYQPGLSPADEQVEYVR